MAQPLKHTDLFTEELEEKAAIAEQLAVLEETAGAWTDANHPDMLTPDDIDRWLLNLRSGDQAAK